MTVSARKMLRLLAWVALVVIILATLVPIDLRPDSGLPVQWERLLAFGLVGFLLALAYPRHVFFVAVLVLGCAIFLEVLQLVTPSRHGRVFDLAVKLAGGSLGIAGGWLAYRFLAYLGSDTLSKDVP